MKLIECLAAADKYTVRILDNAVHKAVDIGARYLERRTDVSREDQSKCLTCVSPLVGAGLGGKEYIEAYMDMGELDSHMAVLDKMSKYAPLLKEAVKIVVYYHIGTIFVISKINQNAEVAEGEDRSLESIARPYMLIGSISAIAASDPDSFLMALGCISLPSVLAMYVGDDNTRGLLDRIKDGIVEYAEKAKNLLPQPQLSR